MQNVINLQYFFSTHPTLFVSLIVWSLVWKGFALYKAGRNNSSIWFIILFVVNTLGLLEMVYLFMIKDQEVKEEVKSETPSPSPTPEIKTEIITEEKSEIVVEEKKEEISAPVPEVKLEEVKQEINQ